MPVEKIPDQCLACENRNHKGCISFESMKVACNRPGGCMWVAGKNAEAARVESESRHGGW